MFSDRDVMVQEVHHRCSNDLQLVVSLIELAQRNLAEASAKAVLAEIGNRVRILASARKELARPVPRDIDYALREVCDALQAMAEPRGIVIALKIEGSILPLSDAAILAAALSVNELVTNALKHAFEEGHHGRIDINVHCSNAGQVIVSIEDDGLPFDDPASENRGRSDGLGLELSRRLIDQQNGLLISPTGDSKRYELRLPAGAAEHSIN